jgi:hypothetical protein
MGKTENNRDRPPLFSSWSRLYAVVLLNLALQIFLFYLLTKAFQ